MQDTPSTVTRPAPVGLVPRQCKLLGATVKGLGVVVAVSSTLPFCYAVALGADKVTRLVRVASLKREEVVYPSEMQAFETRTERVAYGVWDEVHSLIPAAHEVALKVAA